MSNVGISCDKKNRKIFLITAKREENTLKNVLFGKIDIPKGDMFFQFDSSIFWIVCEITCSSKKTFNRMYSQLQDCLR